MIGVFLAVVAAASPLAPTLSRGDAASSTPTAAAGPTPVTLEGLEELARGADPRVLVALAEVARMRGLRSEAQAARYPSADLTLFGAGPIPEERNDPNHLDSVPPGSRLRNGNFGTPGVLLHAGGTFTWPLLTFGKIGAYEDAADRGVAAMSGLAEAARQRAARDAAEIFWGYQLAREALSGLVGAEKELSSARTKVEAALAAQSPQASRQDLSKLDLIASEIASRREEAAQGAEVALEAGRMLAGLAPGAPFAFAEAKLEAPQLKLAPLARYLETALARRPLVAAAREGVRAREALVRAREREFLPDLALAGMMDVNWSNAATPQTNPFAYDPYNRLQAGAGLALHGTLDFAQKNARLAQARAELEKARAEASLAEQGTRLELTRAYAALQVALAREARMRDEETAARRWLTQAGLAFESGVGEAQDALIAALVSARAGAERVAAAREVQVGLADLAAIIGIHPREIR